MNRLSRHITSNLLTGLVAILPIGGLVISVAYIESSLSSAGLTHLPFYFPGLGILLALLIIYFIGLVLTTFIGRWLWTRLDKLLDRLPALGKLYASLKQILGYGEGEQAIFQQTVLVTTQNGCGKELGLITNRMTDNDGQQYLSVFIPGSPNPTTGRLVLFSPEDVETTDIPVNEVFKTLIAAGQHDLPLQTNANNQGVSD